MRSCAGPRILRLLLLVTLIVLFGCQLQGLDVMSAPTAWPQERQDHRPARMFPPPLTPLETSAGSHQVNVETVFLGSDSNSVDEATQMTDDNPPDVFPPVTAIGLPHASSTDIPYFSYIHSTPSVYPSQPQRSRLREVILSASFPRTGSTWLYTLLEQASGMEGCSLYPSEVGSRASFGGSGAMDDVFGVARSVYGVEPLSPADNCLAKTHFPYLNMTIDGSVRPSRLLILVRNPIDAVLSFWLYTVSRKFNGNRVVTDPSLIDKLKWEGIARLFASPDKVFPKVLHKAKLYMQWVRYWRTLSNALIEFHPEIPVKIVRYEDLCATTATVVSSIMDFAGIPPKVPGTGLSDVPSAACGANFGENIRILSPDMMASLVNETKAAVEWFDYADTIRDLLTRHENLRVSGLLQVLPEEHRKTTRGINRLSKPQGPRLRRPNRADNA